MSNLNIKNVFKVPMSGNIRKLDKCSLLPTLRTASGTDTLGVINNSLIELKVYSKRGGQV